MSETTHPAVELLGQGFGCASAILATQGEPYGITREVALKVPAPFGIGMTIAKTCGAVTGALMVIGAKHGKTVAENPDADMKVMGLTGQFMKEFLSKYKSIDCKDLLDRDVSKPEILQEAIESGLIMKVCPGIIQDASEIVENILKD